MPTVNRLFATSLNYIKKAMWGLDKIDIRTKRFYYEELKKITDELIADIELEENKKGGQNETLVYIKLTT